MTCTSSAAASAVSMSNLCPRCGGEDLPMTGARALEKCGGRWCSELFYCQHLPIAAPTSGLGLHLELPSPIEQPRDAHGKEDGVEHRGEVHLSRPEERNRDLIDDNPGHPVLDVPAVE